VLAQGGRRAGSGVGRVAVDGHVGLLQQPPGAIDVLPDEPLSRGLADYFPGTGA
jgi:hypothetical protein